MWAYLEFLVIRELVNILHVKGDRLNHFFQKLNVPYTRKQCYKSGSGIRFFFIPLDAVQVCKNNTTLIFLTFALFECPPECICHWLDPLTEDDTGLQFWAVEEVLRHKLEKNI